MLPYWEYEEFVIHSFQDSLSRSALDWFMSLKAEDIPTWEDLSRRFTNQYRYCAETPPTLLELSTKEMVRGQRFEEYATKWRAQAAKHIPLITPTPVDLLFSPTDPTADELTAVQSLCARLRSALSTQAPGVESPSTGATEPYSAGSTGRRRAKPTPQTIRTTACSSLSYISATPGGQPDSVGIPGPELRPIRSGTIQALRISSGRAGAHSRQLLENPPPFVINYTPEELTVGFTGHVASSAPFVVDIPAREPFSDSKVPWTYEGSVGSIEQQFSVMGMTRSGWVYESPVAKDKGKVPAVEDGATPESSPFSPKKVTEEEAEAFMKVVKASEYKVVEQMAKSPAHISLLTLLLGSEPHREALLRVLTAAQVPKETPPDRIEETIGSIFSNIIPFSSEGWSHSRVLHIVCNCNNYIIDRVMIDNGSALNVCSFIVEEKLITMKGEEDYAIYKETAVPYISVGDDENLPFHSFETISVIRDYRESRPSRADRMIGKLNRGIPVPPLSRFFPGPSHTIGGTLDGASSDSDDTPATPSAVCAVTEEIPSGIHIRVAHENEELDNWTSVPRYSAVIADV
ncbi:hypothetical protein CRG98_021405 [Punica granatum]|uniref:Retrotransposon gag domain-containing protein n=1 Tax=Punica granatum TaxID=22663 RepID=A0A2I0JQL3_PUNGR|nr:hypothetical protein CRG98_021405 [Punica granatum]